PTAGDDSRVWTAETIAGAWRVHAQPAAFDAGTLVLIAATPLADVFRERHEVAEAMWVGFPVTLLFAGLGGFWLASIGLRPITRMAERASRIPLTGIQDVGESGRSDELG